MSLKNIITEGNTKAKRVEGGIFLPIQVGDIILRGRFKNRKVEVKSIEIDEHGMPKVNGVNITNFRFFQEEEDES